MLRLVKRSRGNEDLHAELLRRTAFSHHEFITITPHHQSVETAKDLAEVHRRILDDPVELPLRPGDKAVEARGYAIDKLTHNACKHTTKRPGYFLNSSANPGPSNACSPLRVLRGAAAS